MHSFDQPLTDLDKIIMAAHYWTVDDDSMIKAVLFPDNEIALTDEELSEYDPLLPVVVRANHLFQKTRGFTDSHDHIVMETLALMTQDYRIYRYRGHEAHGTALFHNVQEFNDSKLYDGSLRVTGTLYKVTEVACGGHIVPVVRDSSPGAVTVKKHDLTVNHPNWSTLWDLSENAGLTLHERLRLAFPHTPLEFPNVEMTQLNFE